MNPSEHKFLDGIIDDFLDTIRQKYSTSCYNYQIAESKAQSIPCIEFRQVRMSREFSIPYTRFRQV